MFCALTALSILVAYTLETGCMGHIEAHGT